ncbi:hypothetical protein RYX36_001233 [Vicia faba]
MLKSLDMNTVVKYQIKIGSLFNSLATTAAAFHPLKNADCLSYLQSVLQKFGNAAKDKLKVAGIVEDEMAALEWQLAPAADKTVTKKRIVGFVSAGVESQQSDGGMKCSANHEEIEKKTIPMRKIKMRLHKKMFLLLFLAV